MSHRLEIEGVGADDLVGRITAAVLAELRPMLAASGDPMLVDGDRMAELAGISRPLIDRLRAAGTIPSVMIGRRRLYRPVAVIDALDVPDDDRRATLLSQLLAECSDDAERARVRAAMGAA